MIMLGDKKKAISVILGKKPEGEMSEASPEGEASSMDAKLAAAQDLMDAVKSGSAEGVVQAMQDMYELCEAEEEAAEEESY